MKRRRSLLLSLILLVAIPGIAHAQALSGILDPTRAIDWTNPGVNGGIQNRTIICATVAAYTGSASAINSAIASCPAGQVVKLGVGTFNISSTITFAGISNVTLRGSGPKQTIVNANGGVEVTDATAHSTNYFDGKAVGWVGLFAKGATTIQLNGITTSEGTLTVGKRICLDQNDDNGSENGGVMVTALSPSAGYQSGPVGRTGTGYPAGSGGGRSQRQHVTVTSITNNGNGTYNIGITPAIYMNNWRSSQSPAAFWSAQVTEGNGIEDMTLNWNSSGQGIRFVNSWNNWVKNVRSLFGARNHIWLYWNTAHNTIRDSYFFQVQSGGGSQSYGVESYSASNNLIENNMCERISACVMTGPHTGDVVGYNYNFNVEYSVNWNQGTYMGHDAGAAFNLYEGNHDNTLSGDTIHGTGQLNTGFRNKVRGKDPDFTANTSVIYLEAFNRAYNFIGNVLGVEGYHNTYEGSGSAVIYNLGNTGGGSSGTGSDAMVKSSLMRWGNYDVVNATVRWDTTEAQPGAITWVSTNTIASPSNHTLPVSLYLSARPAWFQTPWGTPPWPPIGPDVTGGTISGYGGHANKIPAQLCLENISFDPAYGSANVRLFDASTCYASASSSGLAPPQGLSAVVH